MSVRLISHRGNLKESNPSWENHPDYLKQALDIFEVETDVWYVDNKLCLGHDEPQYEIKIDFLLHPKIWCHAKNLEALELLRRFPDCHYFWHEEDTVTLTSQNYVWTYPGKPLIENSVVVMPERVSPPYLIPSTKVVGICTDCPYSWL